MNFVTCSNLHERAEQWTENNLGHGGLIVTFKTEKLSDDEAENDENFEDEPFDPSKYLESSQITDNTDKNEQEMHFTDHSELNLRIKEEPVDTDSESVLPDVPETRNVPPTTVKQETDTNYFCQRELVLCDSVKYEEDCDEVTDESPVYRCTTCQTSFESQSDLGIHAVRCSQEVALKNAIKARLKAKLGLSDSNPPLSLRHLIPEKETSQEKNPPVHGNCKPLPGKKYSCNLCGASFLNRSNVRVHKVLKHSSDRKFECNICKAKFKIKFILKKHINTKHSEVRNFCCLQCDAKFKTKHELISHTRFKHTDERNFQCRTCGSKFKTKAHLQAHESNRHTTIRSFRCDMCSATFKSKAALNRHLKYNSSKLHSNVTVYECASCNMRFKAELPLKLHMALSHSKDKIGS